MSEITDQRMYALADLLGMSLTFKNGVVAQGTLSGQGKWKQNCGLLSVYMNAKIVCPLVGATTAEPMAFIVALSGDLALGVYYTPATTSVQLFIMDAKKFDYPLGEFFEREYCIVAKDGRNALVKAAKACYGGQIRTGLILPIKLAELLPL